MKKTLIILITLCPILLLGQSVQFSYDDAGNRTSASIIISLVSNDDIADLVVQDKKLDFEENEAQSIDELNIKVYPNPTTAQVNISFNTSITSKEAKLQLYSGDGQLLDDRIIKGEEQLDLQEYSSGIFYVHVLIGQVRKTYKVIKLN